MRNLKKLIVMVILACGLLGVQPVSAADDRLGTVVDGSLLTDDTSADLIENRRARGVYLCGGSGKLSIVSGRKLQMTGTTNCYQVCDQVNVKMLMQKLVGNSWQPVLTRPKKTAYNTYYVSDSATKSVTGGYYYRAYGLHSATEGSTTESVSSHTNGLWVY